MPSVVIQITRFVDESFPGFVECKLIDAKGETHIFIDKVPVVSLDALWSSSAYPCAGNIRCTVETEFKDESGRTLVRIDTEYPDHVESTSGDTHFVVASLQIEDR